MFWQIDVGIGVSRFDREKPNEMAWFPRALSVSGSPPTQVADPERE